jgi:hypothetical protein
VGGFNHLQPPFPRGYLALSGDIYGYYTGLGERSGTNVYWVETRDADKARTLHEEGPKSRMPLSAMLS